MHVILDPGPDAVRLSDVSQDGRVLAYREVPRTGLAEAVREREATRPRWVWADTHLIYPELLAAGVRVDRCLDLRLAHAILRAHPVAGDGLSARTTSAWAQPRTPAAPDPHPSRRAQADVGLFELSDLPTHAAQTEHPDPIAEFAEQQRALRQIRDGVEDTEAAPARGASSTATGSHARPGADKNYGASAAESAARLALLIAAESAGALVAAEMTFAGVPWDVGAHNALLTRLLGPRPTPGHRPRALEDRLAQIRDALESPHLNPDSAPDLLRALHHGGIQVRTTRTWELEQVDHPAITPLLEYKKLSRLMSANGWHWLETWVRDGRFRPVYVPGGVVTGRWASDGGGALQLPHQVRSAVRADPGWSLVVADAAQLEPRILAAVSGDPAMARAGRGEDMYAAMVTSGAVETREQAKIGILGAMYGGTSGESGRMLPRLTKAFGQAIAFVEEAAQTGVRGGRVQTWLGRTSPVPDNQWQDLQRDAAGVDASPDDVARARTQSRSWGRFTRNFVIQGTAAEWALTWLAIIRQRLHALSSTQDATGSSVTDGPHLVFFLHDEVMVHSPAHLAEQVGEILRESAHEAGRLLFGPTDRGGATEFPITVAVVDSYDRAS